MYLKQLDIVGFKSFADKTRLTFEPGMIAIVGPNGCGKSNVSDAIRWVLGEQRPTALRCSKLVDVVFNGTDTRKPLGLCEVSITFADCEKELGTEYHEVTVTRRVYRSGEGEYFLNKVRCGLKDIKRLFMGTGIGTSSYSVMAQGQIDAILSLRPEDRRAVFEEAAGITKFKADRKEAMRKIEQTEQNLVREADVLREMKRQIGSLQRQVGKAKRYKELRDELRGLDVFLSKRRIADFNRQLEENANNQRIAAEAIEAASAAVTEAERAAQNLHAEIHAAEERLAAIAAEAAAADSAYSRAQEVISVNESRIAEYYSFLERDGREVNDTRTQLEELAMQLESLAQKSQLLDQGIETAKAELADAEKTFKDASAKLDALRASLQQARAESVACDRRSGEIRAEIAELEARAHAEIVRRERLASEEAQWKAASEKAAENLAEVRARLETAKASENEFAEAEAGAEEARAAFAAELDDLRANFGKMQSEAAAREAQLSLLESEDAGGGFAEGAKALLDGTLGLPADGVVGSLADRFSAPAEYRVALEAALRCWLDAVVVKDAEAAKAAVAALVAKNAGSARVVSATAAHVAKTADAGIPRLLDKVTVSDDFKSAAEALIGDVFVADDTAALLALPDSLFEGANAIKAVSKDGAVRCSWGAEAWLPGSAAASPLSRRMLLEETSSALAELKTKIEEGRRTLEMGAEKSAELARAVREAGARLTEARRQAAQAEGEFASVERDAAAAAERYASVAAELKAVADANAGDEEKRTALKKELEELTVKRDELVERTAREGEELAAGEVEAGEASRILTERRISVGQMEAERSYTNTQREDVSRRREELERTIAGREEGIRGYEESIERLSQETAELSGSLDGLREKAAEVRARSDGERAKREELQVQLGTAEMAVAARRAEFDQSRDMRSRLEVQNSEITMRRQNQYDHLQSEYAISPEQVVREPDPEWKRGEIPPDEEIASRVEKLNAQIQELGPVNMVAIEEFQELEERYTREKAQEADLLAAKEQILQLITNLNTQSGDLFKQTFEQANANFQHMFTKLFNGGEARLALLENAEDPLECGIDIIARPPGKRPQSVTLLSGGERTMTAVALLFAIFMIKPAPFCMLDELDAALDDSNIGRFVQALKDFLDHSQFLIITHNQHTIAGSDLVYGVSQQEKGISRIISMRLTDIGVKPVPEDKA